MAWPHRLGGVHNSALLYNLEKLPRGFLDFLYWKLKHVGKTAEDPCQIRAGTSLVWYQFVQFLWREFLHVE